MKATLEFELPEDDGDFLSAKNGATWKEAIWELDQHLRSLSKHGDSDTVKIGEVRDKLYVILNELNLQFD